MDVLVGQSWIEDFLNDSSELTSILSPFPEAKVAERVWKSTASWTEHTSAVIGRCKRANCQGDGGHKWSAIRGTTSLPHLLHIS